MPRNWVGLLIAFALGVMFSGTVMGLLGRKTS